jgi:CHASE1-domain containing sensor protein
MQLVGRDSQARSRHARGAIDWLLPAGIFVVGGVLSLLAFLGIRLHERNARRTDFEHRAVHLAATAEDSFDTPLEVLRSIPAFFEASEEVTRAEFKAFVSHALRRYPWIYALEWIPRVPDGERAAYEAAAVADGLVGYHFKQDAPTGPPVLAEPRTEYYPLYYMEPPNHVALGLEETALSARRLALERARDSGETAMSERLVLVQDERSTSVIAFHPVYRHGERPTDVAGRRASIRGLAAVVFRVAPVLAASLRREDPSAFDLAIVDVDAQPPTLLYESASGVAQAQAARANFEYSANVAGRRWLFRVGDSSGFVTAGDAGWPALGVGLLLSILLAGLAYVVRSVLRLRGQVEAARKLGQYTLVEKLGEGGMGVVYRAHHATLRRPTAIKLLDPARANPALVARFESEVQLTSALSHPNTVIVYDYGHNAQGVFYYAMEYIEGITLQALVDADGPQAPERVVPILIQIASALSEAHAIGLIHRDVKPSNIMLCNRGGIPDFVKVLDFGLAKQLSAPSDARQSQSAVLLGTPLYAAPELALGRGSIDAKVDLYALGAVGYFLLTGTPVFGGNTTVEVCAKHISLAPEPPSARLGKPVPGALESLILQCLAKDPGARPASAEAMVASLRRQPIEAWDSTAARAWWSDRGAAIERDLRQARERLAPDAVAQGKGMAGVSVRVG